ncbi:MAG: ABC transporter substrate-binding protein, partial [Lentisphaeria bacterium]
VYFYRFNCSRPPFDNKLVRQAFSMSINRLAITKHILGSGEQATAAFCPPVADYQPVQGFTYDVEKAQKLLQIAGYTPENFPAVEIFFNTSDNNKKIAEAICAQWRENLGVNVSLRNTEWKTFLPMQNNLQYDISRSGWIGDYNDPETFFSIFTSNDGNNRCGFKNNEYDELFAKTQTAISTEERMKIFQRMEVILNREEAPIAPIYYYMSHGLISDKIEGWYPNIQSIHPVKFIRKNAK